MTDPSFNPAIVQPVSLRCSTCCKFDVLRLDKVHPVISGNKWFKLKYYILEAKEKKKTGVATFGGPYSNHLIATAAACQLYGLNSIGMVRGEEPEKYSDTLLQCREYGMQLFFLNRNDYREKKIPRFVDESDLLIVNEGGYGSQGVKGIREVIAQLSGTYTHFLCAVGTGTTMAGIIGASTLPAAVIGISAMKNNFNLERDIDSISSKTDIKRIVNHDYHFGGYAKHPDSLINYMNDLFKRTGIPTDIVYTSKLFYAIEDLAQKGYFPDDSKLLIIHSGGLQGNSSLEKGTLIY